MVIFDWHSDYKGVYVVPDPQTSMALYGLTCHTSSVWSVKALRLLSSTLPSLPCRLFWPLLRGNKAVCAWCDRQAHHLDTSENKPASEKERGTFQPLTEAFKMEQRLCPEGEKSDHAGMFTLARKEAVIVIARRFLLFLTGFNSFPPCTGSTCKWKTLHLVLLNTLPASFEKSQIKYKQ